MCAKGYQDPLYLVTNVTVAEEACRLYAKRLGGHLLGLKPESVLSKKPFAADFRAVFG